MSNDDEWEQLKEETTFGTRDDGHNPYEEFEQENEADDGGLDEDDPVDRLTATLEAVDRDELPASIGARDGTMAGYFAFLKEEGRLEEVGEQLKADMDGGDSIDPDDKAALLRLSLRYALANGAPEEWDLIRDAVGKQNARNA